ncbi:MAG: MFS transporter, partial [Pseudomonadota bacterium]|nr:MFS transporter [Pseudomonadota bacterium]
WGGDYSQGKAFGILDGGRGLLATIVSMAAILIYTAFLPIEINSASEIERLHGFKAIIWLYSILTALIGILVWFFLPESQKHVNSKGQTSTFHNLKNVLKNRLVWLNAGIIVCAYSTYKGLDNTTLYAHEILGMNEVNAAKLFTYGSLTRPVAAILAGVFADRWVSSRVILFLFTALVFLFGMLAIFDGVVSFPAIIIINIFVTFFLVFAIRGIYFALIQETRTKHYITGTAVGIVSFIGFTPEIFFGSISGRILDANPGLTGHQNYFLFLTIIALVGIGITATLRKINK